MLVVSPSPLKGQGVLALLFLFLAWPALAQTFPPLSGRVVDAAGLLDAGVEQQLTQQLAALEASTGDQLVIATVPSLQGYPIEDYGYRLGRAWKLGQAKADNGVILLVALAERRVRIEAGYGLEPVLTDAWSSRTIQRQIVPRLNDGDIAGGVTAGARAIIERLSIDKGAARKAAIGDISTHQFLGMAWTCRSTPGGNMSCKGSGESNLNCRPTPTGEMACEGGGLSFWMTLVLLILLLLLVGVLKTFSLLGFLFKFLGKGIGFSGGGGSFGGGGASGRW